MVVLAPPRRAPGVDAWSEVVQSHNEHTRLLHEAQRLRGSIYAAEGAIDRSQLTRSGRHEEAEDYDAWHVLTLDAHGEVSGCMRSLQYPATVTLDEMTTLRGCRLAKAPETAMTFRLAFEALTATARRHGRPIGVPGGWAVRDDSRGGTHSFKLVFGIFAIGLAVDFSLALLTATTRHRSASMLRRLGAQPLAYNDKEVSRYFEPHYGCDMELLVIDRSFGAAAASRRLAPLPSPRVIYAPTSPYSIGSTA